MHTARFLVASSDGTSCLQASLGVLDDYHAQVSDHTVTREPTLRSLIPSLIGVRVRLRWNHECVA